MPVDAPVIRAVPLVWVISISVGRWLAGFVVSR
jgi:hypothetical protein